MVSSSSLVSVKDPSINLKEPCMSPNDEQSTTLFGNGDELPSNHSGNPHINQLLNQGLARRHE